MTTKEIASKLIEFCNTGQFQQAHAELYAENACSIEPNGDRVDGLDAIKQKGIQWSQMVEEVHGAEISAPLIAGNQFAFTHMVDVSFRGQGRMKMDEISVYQVKDGKIVKEQFFHDTE